jgi:tRNA-specific 2-thiouridylase
MLLRNKKIFVGVSGGVDSAVSCLLLKLLGAKVTGVFIKGWYPEGFICSWKEDRADAMRVCAFLHIPFVTLDASAQYKQSVIEYMVNEYKNGNTPNPDIMCNRDVKFGVFYKYAMKAGADAIATGHYARIIRTPSGSQLTRHKDAKKDQSYFLYAIAPETLKNILFPLSFFPKTTTRFLAHVFSLPVRAKKDSQGICFLGSVSLDEFLSRDIPHKEGAVLTKDGKRIGSHSGVLRFTIGERVPLAGVQSQYFVVSKNIPDNILVVDTVKDHSRKDVSFVLTQTNFFERPASSEVVDAQYRYHGPLIRGRLTNENTFLVEGTIKEYIAPGQSVVLYRKDHCLGGGILQ